MGLQDARPIGAAVGVDREDEVELLGAGAVIEVAVVELEALEGEARVLEDEPASATTVALRSTTRRRNRLRSLTRSVRSGLPMPTGS